MTSSVEWSDTEAASAVDAVRDTLSDEDLTDPLREAELDNVRVVRPAAARKLWRTPPRAEYSGVSAEGERVFDAARHRAAAAASSANRRLFLTPLEMPADQYPLVLVHDCESWLLPNFTQVGVRLTPDDEREVIRSIHALRYARTKAWFEGLPVLANESVYVVFPVGLETLVAPWELVTGHREAFFPQAAVGNALDDDPRWHLVIDHDALAVFACTRDYADEHGMPTDSLLTAPLQWDLIAHRLREEREADIAEVLARFQEGHRSNLGYGIG